MITEAEYLNYANEGYSIIPLSRNIDENKDTPISIYLKASSNEKNTFLLESVEGGDRWAQYSIIGLGCKLSLIHI